MAVTSGGPDKRGALLERVRGLRRSRADSEPTDEAERLERLERRIEHLEAALEGLQDAVHRESTRQSDEIDELRHRTTPGEMARALSDDARRRGL
jgi:phage shock protein A